MKEIIICMSVYLLIIVVIVPSVESIIKDISMNLSPPSITQTSSVKNCIENQLYFNSNNTTFDGMTNIMNDSNFLATETISTSVNTISPYEIITKPLTITANGDANLDRVLLWYRYSPDNVSWSDRNTWFTWMDTANDEDEFKYMDYPNTARILWHNSSTICAYVAVYASGGKDEGITILNVTDSDNPVEMNHKSDSIYLNGAHDIQIVNYCSNSRVAFIISYSGTNRYITSWNVTNPYHITMMDTSPPFRSAIGMYLTVDIINKILYATWYDGYLSSYDISDPSNIIQVDLENYGLDQPWYPCYNNGHVYVGNIGKTGGIMVFGVLADGTITWEKKYNESHSMPMPQVKDNYLYIIDNTNNKFVIFNVIDPDDWVWKSSNSWGSGTEATHFCLDDNNFAYLRIYNGTTDNGIHVVNVTSKTAPTHYAWLAYNTRNLMRRCHWMEVFYNNITSKYNLFVINYVDNAWIQYDISYFNNITSKYHLKVINYFDNTSFQNNISNWSSFGADFESPWSWSFTFPYGYGYYEFYSIGKKNKEMEFPPDTMDARCLFTTPPPNTPRIPNGDAICKINREYTYTTNTTQPNGNLMWYWFDWGDGMNSEWVGPFASGVSCSVSHAWTKRGTYQIQVKAIDLHGRESAYSDPFEIKVRYIVSEDLHIPSVFDRLFDNFPFLFEWYNT
jgi:hypothetical protein